MNSLTPGRCCCKSANFLNHALQWRHNECSGISNHQPHDCLLNCLFNAQIIKALRHWPLWGEFTGDQGIPHTKGQQQGKCFHMMTLSCVKDRLLSIFCEYATRPHWWLDITWLCDILALVWHFGPACVTFRPGLCDILALSCVTKASACHHIPILTTGAVYRKFHWSSVSKTT